MDGGRHNGFISKPYTRTGNNSTQNGLVEYSIEAKTEIKKIFKEAELPTPSFNKLKKNDNKAIDTFKNAIAKAKQSLGDYGASVELKDDYTDINLYLSEDGESGFGIKPNGDIVSVFSNNKAEGGRSAYMLEMAISQGGRQLDCFDIYLVEIYEAHGFKPVAKMKWDDEYIPEGWNKDNFKDYNNGEPDVVFMVYDPNNTKKDNEIPYITDYDDGDKIQQKYFAKNKVDSLIDAKKKEFKESDVNRDEDGKFATKNSNNKSNEETKAKLSEARRIKRYIENKFKTETMSNYEKDKWKEILKETIDEINEIKGIKTKDKKDNDKDNNKDKKDGLDYGDLPKELHEPFKRLNTTEKPSQYVFNNDNEYGLTIEDIIEISKSYDNVENVFCRINQFDFDITGEGDIEGIDLSNRDNLKSKIEKFLYDFTCNSDNAKFDWREIYESTIKPQLKQMIKNSPIMKGKAYRVENWHQDREEIVEGGKINFDCRSVSDDNRGYETVCNFSQEDYEAGDDIYIFVFPEDTRGLNIQGCSVYPNQHEYLVDGDFIIKKVYKDEFDRTIVDLTKAE